VTLSLPQKQPPSSLGFSNPSLFKAEPSCMQALDCCVKRELEERRGDRERQVSWKGRLLQQRGKRRKIESREEEEEELHKKPT